MSVSLTDLSGTGAVTLALLNKVNGSGAQGITNPKLKAGIEKAAADLKAAGGAALVVSGSNNPDIQVIVNAINEATAQVVKPSTGAQIFKPNKALIVNLQHWLQIWKQEELGPLLLTT